MNYFGIGSVLGFGSGLGIGYKLGTDIQGTISEGNGSNSESTIAKFARNYRPFVPAITAGTLGVAGALIPSTIRLVDATIVAISNLVVGIFKAFAYLGFIGCTAISFIARPIAAVVIIGGSIYLVNQLFTYFGGSSPLDFGKWGSQDNQPVDTPARQSGNSVLTPKKTLKPKRPPYTGISPSHKRTTLTPDSSGGNCFPTPANTGLNPGAFSVGSSSSSSPSPSSSPSSSSSSSPSPSSSSSSSVIESALPPNPEPPATT